MIFDKIRIINSLYPLETNDFFSLDIESIYQYLMVSLVFIAN